MSYLLEEDHVDEGRRPEHARLGGGVDALREVELEGVGVREDLFTHLYREDALFNTSRQIAASVKTSVPRPRHIFTILPISSPLPPDEPAG